MKRILIGDSGNALRAAYTAKVLAGAGRRVEILDLRRGRATYAHFLSAIPGAAALVLYPPSVKALLPILAARLGGVPVILDLSYSSVQARIHESGWHPGGVALRLLRCLERQACRSSSHVLAHSRSDADWLASEYKLRKEAVTALPYFADPDDFHPQERDPSLEASLNLRGRIVIQYNGGFHRMHGVRTALDAVPHVVRRCPEALFLFVDIRERATFRDAVRARAAELGVAAHVAFTTEPSLGDHPRYLSLADIFLGAFSGEEKMQRTLRGTVLEAMAMGKAVVHAWTREMAAHFEDERDVLFCRPDDPVDLGEKLTALVRDPGLRARVAGGGLAFVSGGQFRETMTRIVAELGKGLEDSGSGRSGAK